MKKRALSPPVGEMSGYRTFVSPSSYHGNRPEDYESGGNTDSDSRWPVPAGEGREKQRALPNTPDHRKVKDRQMGPTYFNKPSPPFSSPSNLPNWRTVSRPGDRGELSPTPTKFDYGTPRRQLEYTAASPNVPRIPSPSERQHPTRGIEKRKSRQYYKTHKNEILRKRKKFYKTDIKTKQHAKRQRYQKLRDEYPSRYKRQGISPFYSPAERTKAWRGDEKEEKIRSEGLGKKAEDWGIFMKKTEPPESNRGQSRSQRVPDLTNHPQPGLFRYPYKDQKPNTGVRTPTTQNPSSGSGKVIPLRTDLRTHKNDWVSEVKNTPVNGLEGAKNASSRVAMVHRVLSRYFDRCQSTTTDVNVDMGLRTASSSPTTISPKRARNAGRWPLE